MIYPAKPEASLTKYRLTEADIERLVARGLGKQVSDVQEATNGSFNAVYLLTLDDSREVVLKVSPSPRLDLLTCEFELMRTELLVSRIAARLRMPVPHIELVDFSRRLVPSDYIFMPRLTGRRLDSVKHELTSAGEAEVRRQLGINAARLHTVTGTFFGYPRSDGRTWSDRWRLSFLTMIGDVLRDAQRFGVDLGGPVESIGRIIDRYAALLDDVLHPALIHFDLWDGNVFVLPDNSIEGIIDGERAFFGDPCAEFVSLALFRDFEELPDLLEGYSRESGLSVFSHPSARKRIYLYTIYLYLLMLAEGPTRGYSGSAYEAFLDGVRTRIDDLLVALEKGRGNAR